MGPEVKDSTIMTNNTEKSTSGTTFLPSLTEIQNLTDLEDIRLLLRDTIAREEALDSELESALKYSENMEAKLDLVDGLPRRFKQIFKESKSLATTIDHACDLANNVSKKVRDLDTIRERVKETNKKVTDILDVKNCIEGVNKAMDIENYEEAAGHIQRYLNIGDVSMLEGNSADNLKQAEQKLKDIVKRKLDIAIKDNNEKEIIRFCCLFAPLGMKEEGLLQYSHYLRNVCSTEAEALHKQLLRSTGHSYHAAAENEEIISFVDAITKLFESVAGLIEDQTPMVEEKFGPGSSLMIIKHLQQQSDVHSTKILDLFVDHFGIKRLFEELNSKNQFNKDPRDIAPILDEIALMSQSAELYDKFIRGKAKDAVETAQKSEKEASHDSAEHTNTNPIPTKPKTTDGLLHVSELNRKMQELIGNYMLLEEYFMVESVRKAIRMDEPVEDSLTSSSVDFVFFVLQKSTQRALLTCNLNAICATINIVITVLTRDFKESLHRALQEQLHKSASVTNLSNLTNLGTRADPQKIDYTVILNNIEVSSEYILKIKKEMELECLRLFANKIDARIKSCLDDLVDTSNSFKKLLQTKLEESFTAVTSAVKGLLDVFSTINYELTDLEFAEREINDPFVQDFITGVDAVFSPFKTSLTPSNYDTLVHIVIRFSCQRLEHEVLRKKFNQMGGLQFDKELRNLQNYFSSVTQKTVRDKFARLTQMAALLNLDKVNEVLDYWGQNSGHMTWRLTPSEVRRVLSLRVDFSKDAIAKLKL